MYGDVNCKFTLLNLHAFGKGPSYVGVLLQVPSCHAHHIPCFSQSSWGDLLQKLTVPWFHSARNCFDMSSVLIFSQSFFSRFKQKHIFYKHVVTSCLPPFAKFLVFVFLRCHSLVLTAGSLSLSVPQSQGEVCPFCYISD